MKNIYCILCGKYRKFKNLKLSYIFGKKESIFEEGESIEILKILDLINSIEEYRNKYD